MMRLARRLVPNLTVPGVCFIFYFFLSKRLHTHLYPLPFLARASTHFFFTFTPHISLKAKLRVSCALT